MMAFANASHTQPLFVAINEGSGADRNAMPEKITQLLRDAGHDVTLYEIPKDAPLADACKPLIEKARTVNGMVVAAGGDGTVNGIAKLCYAAKLPLAIIPLGTFNYFARALGIPAKLEDAIALIGNGMIRDVSAGFVADHLFLNNASFGLYPTLIKRREKATARFGRKRIIGAISALHSLFEAHRVFSITTVIDGKRESYRTSMVFVGNNTFQLDTLGLDVSACTRQNRLGVVILNALTKPQMARLIWRGIVKNLQSEEKLQQFCADAFTIDLSHGTIEIVIDGEIITCTSPLTFRVESGAIRVVVPRTESA